MVSNRNIRRYWRPERIWAVDFTGCRGVGSTLSSLTLNQGPPVAMASASIATTVYSPVNTSVLTNIDGKGLYGVKMNSNGDVIRHAWQPPADLDYGFPVYARVLWTSGSSDPTDTILWKLWRKTISWNNDALTGTIDTAMSTVIPQDTVAAGVPFTMCRTSPGMWAAQSFTPNDLQLLALEMDTKDADLGDDIFALGIEVLYVPLISPDIGSGKVPTLPSGWA